MAAPRSWPGPSARRASLGHFQSGWRRADHSSGSGGLDIFEISFSGWPSRLVAQGGDHAACTRWQSAVAVQEPASVHYHWVRFSRMMLVSVHGPALVSAVAG